jgi:hypothetical protein
MNMKTLLAALLIFSTTAIKAHEIQGTLMLKGALKSKIVVNGVKSTCKLKVEKVKNLLEEDDFGNPAYQARIDITLDGNDFERGIRVKYAKELTVINLHKEGAVKKVKDLEYFSTTDKVTVLIDQQGRLMQTSFTYASQKITCVF